MSSLNSSAISDCSSKGSGPRVARAHPQVSGDTFIAVGNVSKLGTGLRERLDCVLSGAVLCSSVLLMV